MSIGIFLDKEHHPTEKEIDRAWGKRYGLYKALLNLFPQDGFCIAQVVLGREQIEKAKVLKLGKRVAEVFSKVPQFHDGRWLYAPVKTAKDAKDIQELVALKRKPTPGKK